MKEAHGGWAAQDGPASGDPALFTPGAGADEARQARRPAGHVTRGEWLWAGFAALAILALSEIPNALGIVYPAPGLQFSGITVNVSDNFTYLSAMQQGADGAWLFSMAYTTQPGPGTLLKIVYVLAGRLVGVLGLPVIAGYHLLFAAGTLAMSLSTYWFIALFVHSLRRRRFAWLLVEAGGGLSWVMGLATGGSWLLATPPDFFSPEAFTSLAVLYHLPHLLIARAGLLAGLRLLIVALERGSLRRAMSAGFLWLLASLALPFEPFVIGALTGTYLVALGVKRRGWPWKEIRLSLAAGAWLVPWVAYLGWLLLADPRAAAWNEQNIAYSPPLAYYLAAFALHLFAAAFAVSRARREERRLWLLVWIIAAPLWIYLPFKLQRRLVEGVQVPLSILAAIGLGRLQVAVTRHRPRLRNLLPAMFLAALLPTNLIVFLGTLQSVRSVEPPAYYPDGAAAVASWLELNADGADVWSSPRTGELLPGLASVHVDVGHKVETPDYAVRAAQAGAFYRAAATDAERRALLAAAHIEYVVYGPYERALARGEAPFAIEHVGYLEPVFRAGEWALYRVQDVQAR